MPSKRRVVVTGLGVATPIGIGIDAFWEGLLESRCGIRKIEAFDSSEFASRVGGELPPFQLGDFIPKGYRKNAKVMARDIVIAVTCAYHAVRDAGLNTKCIIERGEAPGPPNVDSTRFGANIGAGLICADLSELASALSTAADEQGGFSLRKWGLEGMNNLTPLWLLKFLPNMLACHVTIVHDAQAPSNTITCGEASSHLAIGEAFRTIARGDADVCICGGAESKINPMALARPLLGGRLNIEDNETPERACRPFGRNRKGTVVSEGGGLVILEALDHARARGARIYAELVGFGAACGVSGAKTSDPTIRAMSIALTKAVADAGTNWNEVDLLSPFCPGTGVHDAAESDAWSAVLGDRASRLNALTSRGAVGVNGAGTGALDFAATVMAVHRNTIPPSANTAELDEHCPIRFVQGVPKDARIRQAVTLGYALSGGQTAALVLRKFQE